MQRMGYTRNTHATHGQHTTRLEQVSTLIRLLENGIGKKANITQAPISAGDVPITFADVSHARELLGARRK